MTLVFFFFFKYMQPTCGSWTHDLIHHPIIMGEVPVELVPFFFKEKSNMNWFRLMLQFYHMRERLVMRSVCLCELQGWSVFSGSTVFLRFIWGWLRGMCVLWGVASFCGCLCVILYEVGWQFLFVLITCLE